MRKYAWICGAVVALLLPVSALAQQCEPEKVATKYPGLADKVITMGLDPKTPPYAIRNPQNFDEFAGIDVELAAAVFDCLGLKYKLAPGDWSGLFPAVIAGQIDMMYYIYYSPERAKQADFVTYMKAGIGAVTQAGNPQNIQSEKDLCGKRVVVLLGSVGVPNMEAVDKDCKANGKLGPEVTTSSDGTSGMRLVQNNRVDIMVDDLVWVDTVVKENPTKLVRAYGVITDTKIGIATRKGNTELVNAMHEGLAAVQAEGREKAIFESYGLDPNLVEPATILTQ